MADPIQVLYVDDEEYLLDIGKLFLEKLGGFSVTTINSAPAALDLLTQKKFDAIVADYQMPEMDGIKFLFEVRKRFGKIPFILFTGRGREEVVIQAINNGVDFYLQKGGEPLAQFAELAHKIRIANERQTIDAALKESEKNLVHAQKIANIGSYIWNMKQDNEIYFSDQMYEIFDLRKDITISSSVMLSRVHPEDKEITQYVLDDLIKNKIKIQKLHFRIVRGNGEIGFIEVTSETTFDGNGKPAESVGTVQDITERKLVEDALIKSEEKLRLKLDSVLSPDVDLAEEDLINIIDKVSIQSLMDDLYAATGMPIGIIDLKGNVLVKVGWQDICKKFHRIHTKTLKNCIQSNIALSSGVQKGEFRAYRCLNNMWDIVTPLFIGDRHVGNIFFGQFFYEDEVPDTQVFIDQAQKYGFEREEYLAALNRVPRWSREKVIHIMRFYAKFSDLVSKLSYSNLKLAKTLSAQKRIESALTDSEEQSRLLLSKLPDIVMVHEEGIVVYANQMAIDKTGFSREELIGSHIFDYIVPDNREIVLRNITRRSEGKQVGDYEVDMLDKSGALHHVIVRTSTIIFNKRPSVVMILIDITDRKHAEMELETKHNELLISYEHLAAAEEELKAQFNELTLQDKAIRESKRELADIKNQLLAQNGYLSVLEEILPDLSLNEYFQKVKAIEKRIFSMIEFTKEYDEIGINVPIWQECHTIVDSAANEALLGQIVVNNNLPRRIEILADPLVQKVFYNLIDNAVRYGEKITKIRFLIESFNGNLVIVCKDDGAGIQDAYKEKIFERGFGKNTGLGLALSREILDITGITIRETGEPGKGARFEIEVPNGMWSRGD